jgi:antitoxin component HigA of HigAB toxin-antitoxin module
VRHTRPGDPGKLIGSKANATLILKGQRELSKAHIRKLAEYFHVSPAVFI